VICGVLGCKATDGECAEIILCLDWDSQQVLCARCMDRLPDAAGAIHDSLTLEAVVDQRTYTAKELAALLGVSPKDIANAKLQRHAISRPDSRVGEVKTAMSARGITWEQIVLSRRGNGVAGTSAGQRLSNPVKRSTSVVADMKPEGAPSPLGQAMSLEDILQELQRRLPGAAITITLPQVDAPCA